jgi:hypothetical protein
MRYAINMRRFKAINNQSLRLWLLVVSIGFGLTLFTCIAVQQSLRLSLNDPQWQIAEDAAFKLSQGANPTSVVPNDVVDESRSLASFVTVVDSNIHVLASSGKIGTIVPLPPASAFPDAQKRGNNWFTWQHDNNTIRDATVIIPYQGPNTGYVLVARSMSSVEKTIKHITGLAGLTLLGVLLAPAIILWLV